MAQPYVGEIRMFAGNFAPAGWAFCGGQSMPISEYETLFQLIGTTYGGDGETYFNLPDMRGRLPVHQGGGFILGETGGVEEVTLTIPQIPAHKHGLITSGLIANSPNPDNRFLSVSSVRKSFNQLSQSTGSMNTEVMELTGGGQPHSNMQPYLCISFIISFYGIFPSQS